MAMDDETSPLEFDRTGPARFYLAEALASTRWGAAVAGIYALALEVFQGRSDPLAMAVFLVAFMALCGGGVCLWAWVSGFSGFEGWSGRLPSPHCPVWLIGSSAAGAAAGWSLYSLRVRGNPAAEGATWMAAVVMGGLVGSSVTVWRGWGWLGRPRDAPGLVDLGVALAGSKPAFAISCFTTALQVSPSYARAAYERANLLLGRRHGDDLRRAFRAPGLVSIVRLEEAALADLDSAIDLEPGYAPAYLLRASALGTRFMRREFDDGHAGLRDRIRADLTHAIRIDPENAAAYFERARATPCGEDGEMADLDRAIQLAPGVAEYRFSRGRAHRARGDVGRAIADFDEAIRLCPGYPWYHEERAEAFRARGDYGRAEEDLARARDLLSRS